VKEILTIDLELCTGCRNCELACSVRHTQAFNPKRSRIQILKDDMNCVTACIYGGIAIDPQSKKAVKCDLCNGDPACVKACDYGAISVASIKPEGLHQRRKANDISIQRICRTLS